MDVRARHAGATQRAHESGAEALRAAEVDIAARHVGHERAQNGASDLAAILQQEILAVIAKHIPIDRDRVVVKLDRGDQISTLEIDIEMPEAALARN